MLTNAVLNLDFDVQQNQTIMRVRKQEPPLRVIRAFPIETSYLSGNSDNGQCASGPTTNGSSRDDHQIDDQSHERNTTNLNNIGLSGPNGDQLTIKPVLVHLHNVSGGLLGGDRLSMQATVSLGAQVQLTSTSSTRVYRSRSGYPATTQTTDIQVERNGLLEYLPDTLIPYADSKYRQITRIELAHGAGLFYWEVVTPGREAKGECFDYELLQIDLDIVTDGLPVAIERNLLEPDRLRSTTLNGSNLAFGSSARLGQYRYFATFYICRVGVAAAEWRALETKLDQEANRLSCRGQTLWGVSTLPAHGLSVRAVGTSCHAIQQGLPRFWQLAKEHLYHQNAIMPRKIY